jgi:hypothetical protein
MSIWGSMHHSFRASSAAQDAARAAGDARSAAERVRQMEDRLERALLTCEAMWTLVREKFGLTDEELVQRVNDLDLSDGHLDGKMRKTPVACPKCNRTISPRFQQCMYCGQPIVHDPFA